MERIFHGVFISAESAVGAAAARFRRMSTVWPAPQGEHGIRGI
jgi:hypothetical protein